MRVFGRKNANVGMLGGFVHPVSAVFLTASGSCHLLGIEMRY